VYQKYESNLKSVSDYINAAIFTVVSPFFISIGLDFKTGETFTESVLTVGSNVAVTGLVNWTSGCASIIPDYITSSFSDTLSMLAWKYLKYLPFQLLFGGIGYYFYRKYTAIMKKKHELYKKALMPGNFKCIICQNDLEVLFKPCMHLCTCKKCSEKLGKCPICDKKIISKVIIHIS
jgi:Zinc finger, C3HC4 type (RING finger)